jgi:hypothetical protein
MQMDFVSLRCADAAARNKLAAVDESEVLKLKVCQTLSDSSFVALSSVIVVSTFVKGGCCRGCSWRAKRFEGRRAVDAAWRRLARQTGEQKTTGRLEMLLPINFYVRFSGFGNREYLAANVARRRWSAAKQALLSYTWSLIVQQGDGVSSYAQEQAAKNDVLEASMTQALRMLAKAPSAANADAEVQSMLSSSSSSLDSLALLARARAKGQWRGSTRVDVIHVCFGK